MFGSNAKTITPSANGNGTHHSSNGAAPNRLSSDVCIKGSISFSSELVIDGHVEGDIMSEGNLTVGTNGKVIGDIQVGSVTIQGLVEGNVLATDRCALRAGGSLEGDIESPRLAMDEDASFIGSATIKAAAGD